MIREHRSTECKDHQLWVEIAVPPLGKHLGTDLNMELDLDISFGDTEKIYVDNAQTELVILNGDTNLLSQANSNKEVEVIATGDSPTIRAITLNSSSQPSYIITPYQRDTSVASAAPPKPTGKPKKSYNTRQAYQELKMSVLKTERTKIVQEKRKLMAETGKIELEKTLLKLQIKKLSRDDK